MSSENTFQEIEGALYNALDALERGNLQEVRAFAIRAHNDAIDLFRRQNGLTPIYRNLIVTTSAD